MRCVPGIFVLQMTRKALRVLVIEDSVCLLYLNGSRLQTSESSPVHNDMVFAAVWIVDLRHSDSGDSLKVLQHIWSVHQYMYTLHRACTSVTLYVCRNTL